MKKTAHSSRSTRRSNVTKSGAPRPTNSASLFVLALIMMVNALAYGTIIPLLYPYASRFGINPVGLSLLFASFSLAQFIATPILGRLSDRFGRKPVLLLCLLGTSISLGLFASATNVAMLFIARLIDGITGGNISVAQAMIADSTNGNDRAKAFGLLGAAFGFGFLAGPALGGVLSHISLTAPFWFAAALALVGTILGVVILHETLPEGHRQSTRKPLFDFGTLVKALFHPLTGTTLLIGFLAAISQNAFVIGFQSYTVDILKLDPVQIGLIFAMFGIITIIMQVGGLRLLLKYMPSKKQIIIVSLLASVGIMSALALLSQPLTFVIALSVYGITISPIVPVVTSLLSERTKGEDQGGILGINQSYTSLGQIIGPLIAGVIAARLNVPAIFIAAAGFLLLALFATRWLYVSPRPKMDL